MVDHIDDFPVDWFCFLLSFCFALFVLFCFVFKGGSVYCKIISRPP